ncbi:rRNA methyltransferase 3A, mitochondrial [Heterodontus francisci]|uniref:rRNA methyltransferase 3A, mitochondrial n=1 Tax=Heterodontus francisci TaxID=7792 RepID=UPI00355B7049
MCRAPGWTMMAALSKSVSHWGAARIPGLQLLIVGRRHVRALRRRPIETLYPRNEGAAGARVEPSPVSEANSHSHPAQQRWPAARSPDQLRDRLSPSSLDGLSYEKAFPGDKRLAKVVTIAKSKKFRDQHGKILVEGRRLITDALGAGALLQTLFFSTVDSLKELPLEKLKHVQLIKVKFEEIKMWSDLVTPQGAMGIFVRPDHSKMKYPAVQQEHAIPLFLICDNIRDPGNLGTILRSAVAAGCSKVLLTKGCVDAWEPKVLRAGMGAHFRIPVISNLEWDVVPNYLTTSTCVHVADHSYWGAENSVVPPESRAIGDQSWASLRTSKSWTEYQESDSEDEEREFPLSLPKLEAQCYYHPWAQEQTAIVIGGETHGLSLEALLLVEKTRGQRLYIPMIPSVDSLNSAVAASILLFEGRRQLLFNRTKDPSSSVA